ncbi:hypothetical protein GCM10025872_06920 [Barrientosiimonas endolithica]|uniref:Secreted protein n=1 Tax=Barrientosiimonas endolithica TaxID=1535208 RepID=A0ABN6YM26_9MICO|nr:hypothetical protein GCM10025872_06920 [Barrientosiimonas endolithica]
MAGTFCTGCAVVLTRGTIAIQTAHPASTTSIEMIMLRAEPLIPRRRAGVCGDGWVCWARVAGTPPWSPMLLAGLTTGRSARLSRSIESAQRRRSAPKLPSRGAT